MTNNIHPLTFIVLILQTIATTYYLAKGNYIIATWCIILWFWCFQLLIEEVEL